MYRWPMGSRSYIVFSKKSTTSMACLSSTVYNGCSLTLHVAIDQCTKVSLTSCVTEVSNVYANVYELSLEHAGRL